MIETEIQHKEINPFFCKSEECGVASFVNMLQRGSIGGVVMRYNYGRGGKA